MITRAHRMRSLFLMLLTVLAAVIARPALADSYYVEGEGGVPLAVTVTGPEDAPAILFLHGIGMGADSFAPQFNSDLAKKYRLVAFDLRGHGNSGKPWDEAAYTNSSAWAGDVSRVIAATGIDRPVVVAWSYGTIVAADYLRIAGTDGISGLVMIGALGGIVTPPAATAPPDPKILADLTRSRALRAVPTFAAQQEAIALILPMLVHRAPANGWLDRAAVLGMEVPAYAQAGLRKHVGSNSDLVPRLQALPMLFVYGAYDFGVSAGAADAFRTAFPKGQVYRFDQAGHAPFAENPETFDALLQRFVHSNLKETP